MFSAATVALPPVTPPSWIEGYGEFAISTRASCAGWRALRTLRL